VETFIIYKKAVEPKPPVICIADLIPVGRENAIKREELLKSCIQNGIATNDRQMRDKIAKAKMDYVILNNSDSHGYYRPALEDMQDLQRYIRQEEKRAKSTFKNIKRAKALYEDYIHERVTRSICDEE
jgi:hypothetical protein